eukprot:CAMPEP_0172833388 /NCGR_PEP_ID=MMETSP1075-20121228/24333_1 /TAXON_ID=2916 /ORGANISM="Ceratium fusus, Strain PA161109" /LENGTH=84 /DNA_ID=CAMNT_0013676129 /DNA_START=46 /DNA_END=298 /DNA_ORIENTATION=-
MLDSALITVAPKLLVFSPSACCSSSVSSSEHLQKLEVVALLQGLLAADMRNHLRGILPTFAVLRLPDLIEVVGLHRGFPKYLFG